MSDLSISTHDYGSGTQHETALNLDWTKGDLQGLVRIANRAEYIERFEFSNGVALAAIKYDYQDTTTASDNEVWFTGTDANDVISGTRNVDVAGNIKLLGYEGDDTIIAADRALDDGGDSLTQYLYGYEGNDTYVIGRNSGDTRITAFAEQANMGTDTVSFGGYTLNEFDISRDHTLGGTWDGALIFNWAGDGYLQIAEGEENIEKFRFSNGVELAAIEHFYADTTTASDNEVWFKGTDENDVISGTRNVDVVGNIKLLGYEGDDTIIAASRASDDNGDSLTQYLYGYEGNDTYVISEDSGDTRITAFAEQAGMGTDTIQFREFNLTDLEVSFSDYGASSDWGNALIFDWSGDGYLQIANEGDEIEKITFANGVEVTSITEVENSASEQYIAFNGSISDDVITGVRASASDGYEGIYLRGYAGNDKLIAATSHTQDSAIQYLYGREGDDTYVLSEDSGDTRITAYAEEASMGTDTVRLIDFEVQDLNITFNDYGSSSDWGNALVLNWSGDGYLQVANQAEQIERFEFAGGVSLSGIAEHDTANYVTFNGTSQADIITGTRVASDYSGIYLRGYSGDDTIIAAETDSADNVADSSSQYLYGRHGDDTYVIRSNSGDTFITAYAEEAGMGTDTVWFEDLNVADFASIIVDSDNDIVFDLVGEAAFTIRDGAEIENFVFEDGSTFTNVDDFAFV